MPKTIVKSLGALLAAALFAASVFLVNLIWFRPFSLDLLRPCGHGAVMTHVAERT